MVIFFGGGQKKAGRGNVTINPIFPFIGGLFSLSTRREENMSVNERKMVELQEWGDFQEMSLQIRYKCVCTIGFLEHNFNSNVWISTLSTFKEKHIL